MSNVLSEDSEEYIEIPKVDEGYEDFVLWSNDCNSTNIFPSLRGNRFYYTSDNLDDLHHNFLNRNYHYLITIVPIKSKNARCGVEKLNNLRSLLTKKLREEYNSYTVSNYVFEDEHHDHEHLIAHVNDKIDRYKFCKFSRTHRADFRLFPKEDYFNVVKYLKKSQINLLKIKNMFLPH